MLEILPRFHIETLEQNSSHRSDCEEDNSKKPPMHARLTFAQTIAEAANSFDRVTGLAQLLPQSAHVSIDCTGVDHAFVTPDVAEEPITFLNAPAALHQGAQQLEFDASEMNDPAID